MPNSRPQQPTAVARVIACFLWVCSQVEAGPPLVPNPPPAKTLGANAARKSKGGGSRKWPGQGDPHVERMRKCLLKRESEGKYGIVDPSKRWFGGYQFAMVTSNTAARRMKRPDLVDVPANKWSPADQDAAFYVIYDRGRGRKHWAGGRYPCK